MVKCKYCGNEYRQPAAQCPTCGGRKFEDSLMTVQYGAVGYGMMMSAPVVVHIQDEKYLYPMAGVRYVLEEG